MEAVEQIQAVGVGSGPANEQSSNALANAFNRHALAFEKGRFGWMTILITVQSCLGAVACMFILYNKADVLWLSTCAAVSMGSNAAFIAQMSGRWSLAIFYLSIIFNTAFILLNAPFSF